MLKVHLLEHGEMHPMSTKRESPFLYEHGQVSFCGMPPLKGIGPVFFCPIER